jgi:hypothetical protein
MKSRHLILAAAATVLAAAIAGGVAYATIPGPGNVYSACMLRGIGTIRLIDKSLPDSSLMSRCKPSLELEVSWNQAGPQGLPGPQGVKGAPGADGARGADGVSVAGAAEPAGANCAHGGSRFTAANGVTYACNGANGAGGGIVFVADEIGPATLTQPVTAWVTLYEDPALGRVEAKCVHSSAPGQGPSDMAQLRWTNTTTAPQNLGPNQVVQPGGSVFVQFDRKLVVGWAGEPGVIVEYVENQRYDPPNDDAFYCSVYAWVTPHT